MLIIGLTGGIASGKSTVARLFRGLGVPIIDADEISRELVEPGSICLDQIAAEFGNVILDSDSRLDRRKLRELIFNDPSARRRLEAILHPAIRREMQCRVDKLDSPYCILVIPLLIEANQRDLVDRVLVVDVAVDVQRQRLRERDHATETLIDAMLSAQTDRQTRLAAADDVLTNDSNLADLDQQVRSLHQRYQTLAASHG